MYLKAQKNKKIYHQILDIFKELEGCFVSDQNVDSVKENKLKISKFRLNLKQILDSCEIEDLRILYAVVSIGYHERGERHYYSNNSTEVIELEISENEEELLQKHCRYITFLNKEELIDYFLSRARLTQGLIEGIRILKLE